MKTSIISLLTFFILGNVFCQENHTILCEHETERKVLKSAANINGYVTGFTRPHVIDVSINESFSLHFETDLEDVSTINLRSSFFTLFSENGINISSLTLKDDGNGNDLVAGDKIFSSSNLTYNRSTSVNFIDNRFMRFSDVSYTFTDGTNQAVNIDLAFGIRMINGNMVNISPTLTALTNTIQKSSHVVNMSIPDFGFDLANDRRKETNDYYALFPDERDFLMFATTFPTPGGPAANFQSIKRDHTGTWHNGQKFDNSFSYGSSGELNGIIRYFYTKGGSLNLTNHEIFHHWGAALNPSLHLTYGPHWAVIERPSSALGTLISPNIVAAGNECYNTDNSGNTSHYNDLEQYLMGLEPISFVQWPIKVLSDWSFENTPNCRFKSSSGFISITQQDFETAMPPRVPDYTTSQKDFKSALIVISNGLLSPKEMAYYQFQMIQNELAINDPKRVSWEALNFEEATFGKATLETRLPTPKSIYTVNTIDDTDDGQCTANHCSLREAIHAANSDITGSTIHFNISGTAPFIIQPTSGLPKLTAANTTIDGSTQDQWRIGDIIIDGTSAGSTYGLTISNDDCRLYGLQIQDFSFGNILIGNNTKDIHKTIIGAENKENIIIGSRMGIFANRVFDLVISNNYIGIDQQYTTGLGNTFYGIGIGNGPHGSVEILDNHIGKNGHSGILVNGKVASVKVNKNFIGTDETTKQLDLGHRWYGIGIVNSECDQIELNNNLIGGSHNTCINFNGTAKDISINNNTLGINNFGPQYGIRIANGHLNSQAVTNQLVLNNNLITNNGQNGHSGILLRGGVNDVEILRNQIGTNPSIQNLGFNWYGLYLQTNGGNYNITKNTIAYNRYGLSSFINSGAITITESSFFCNTIKGIALSNNSNPLTPPIINFINGNILQGAAPPNGIIEVYKNNDLQCNNAPCQGNQYIGNALVDDSGNWTFTLPNPSIGDRYLTLTNNGSSSSEFSDCVIY